MARINIEECWWSDPRRTKLILKIGFAADSAAVNMWRLGQEWWGKGRSLVPLSVFIQLEHAAELLGCGLAEERDKFVYIRGSSEYLEWHAEKRDLAVIAGKKSAESRRKKYGSAQPNPEQTPNEPRTESNEPEPSLSGSLSGSFSDSFSGSGSISKIENSSNSAKTQAFIAGYCERFKAKYKLNPEILGKEAGIAKRIAKQLSAEKIDLYLDAFFAMPDPWLTKTKHPLGSFETKLNEITVFANSGKFTTFKEAAGAESSTALRNQLQRIKDGDL